MKTFSLYFYTFILIILLYSCEKDDIIEGIIISELDIEICVSPSGFNDNSQGLIISNDSAYQMLFQSHIVCNDFSLPAIDFSRITLLGMYTVSNTPKYYKREVISDDLNSIYIFNIYIKEEKRIIKHQKAAISMNWVLVPKLPIGYLVEFNVEVD